MPKHNVAITLHACPRCGWPNDEETKTPATKAPPAPPAPARRGRPPKPRVVDVTPQARTAPPGPEPGAALEWYRREVCQRLGHTHDRDDGEMKCILLNLAKKTADDEATAARKVRA